MTLSSRVVDLGPFDLLLSVAETGSMGAAARRHGVSQPAVSARLRNLEASLGFALLERSPRGARLTDAGALVAHWARAAVDAAALLEEGVAAVRAEAASRLHVAASLTVAEYLLPRWLLELRSSLPETTVALTSHNSTDTAEDIRRGAADIGFVEGPTPPTDLEAQPVGGDELTVVVGREHPWARRRQLSPAQLAGTSLITREHGSGTRTFLEQALHQAGHPPRVAPALELGSTTSIKNAAAQGIAPAVLSSLTVVAELAAGTLIALPVRGLELHRTLHAIWPVNQRLTGPTRELLTIAARNRDARQKRNHG
jgi:DNA-binding transcriptional LysR family regulator